MRLRHLALRAVLAFLFAVALTSTSVSAQPVGAAQPPISSKPIAMVVDRSGAVSVGEPAALRPVATLAVLSAGTRVQLEAASTLTLLYVGSGDEYTVTGPGAALLDPAGVSTSQGATAKRRASGGAKPAHLRVETLAMGGVVMRSGRNMVALRARVPAGTLTRAPDQFVWQSALADAQYAVELRDESGATVFAGRAQGSSLAFPTTLVLRPTERYTWTVSALGDAAGGASARQEFTLAGDDVGGEARRVRPADDAPFSDRLVYALWLEQAGATGEARQAWQALAEQRPDDDALAARARR